jgi:hypothetical protein
MNNEQTQIYPSSGPSLEVSPTSNRLILNETSVTVGEQSARVVHVLKGVWISCLLFEGKKSIYRQSWGPLTKVQLAYDSG